MTYVVRSGDTMYEIAKRFGVPLDVLIAANPQIKDPNLIYPGQVLNIPVVPHPKPPPVKPPARPSPFPPQEWCALVLTPVHPKCAPGSALVRQRMPHIMVATMDMPDPSSLVDCAVYTAWVMDDDPGEVVAWFDLLPAGRGFWINHTNPKALTMREVVLVTAEPRGHLTRPGSVHMLKGHLHYCCRRDP